MDAVGRASAKLILFGEHAAVYGHSAIGISLPEHTSVRFRGEPVKEWDVRGIPAPDRAVVARLAERLEELVPGLGPRGRAAIEVESNIPRGAGFGSSAALCAAFVRAARAWTVEPGVAGRRREGDDIDAVWGIAHAAERLFHGTPSGIDTGLSLREGMFAIAPRPPALPRCEPVSCARMVLILAAGPRDAACGELIASLARRIRSGDDEAVSSIEALGGIADVALQALQAGGPAAARDVAACADRGMDHLCRLGLGNERMEELIAAGRAAGALGGKLSGAGGGGAFFLVAADEGSAARIARAVGETARRSAIPLVSAARVLQVGG